MAAPKTVYTCSACGGTNPKWLGRCPHCEAWNTLEEGRMEPTGAAASKNRFQALARTQPVATLSEIDAVDIARTPTGLEELDRVLGGGIVTGGVVPPQAEQVYWVLVVAIPAFSSLAPGAAGAAARVA